MLEKEIENLILDYLSYRPGYYWKNQSVGIYDPTKRKFRKSNNRHHVLGVADILGVKNDGQFVAIEVKTKKGRLSENQKSYLQKVADNGGLSFVARSIEDVKEMGL